MAERIDSVRVLLDFEGLASFSALDLSSLIFDFNRLYATLFRFSLGQFAPGGVHELRGFGRNSFRLPRRYELEISKISFLSPGIMEFLVPIVSVGAGSLTVIWLLLQVLEKTALWSLNKRKLELEIEKLERDKVGEPPESRFLKEALYLPSIQSAIRQLARNSIRPYDLTLRVDPRDRI